MRPNLTQVELEIVRLVVEGLGNKEIGERIGWGEDSVRVRPSKVYEKADVAMGRVGVSRRVALAVKAVRDGRV